MLQPEGTKVVIKPDTVEQMTEGRIYIPEMVREKEQVAVTKGEIVAIGPLADIEFGDGTAEVGDRVIYARYGGAMIKWDNIEYRVLHDKDVICRIDGEE